MKIGGKHRIEADKKQLKYFMMPYTQDITLLAFELDVAFGYIFSRISSIVSEKMLQIEFLFLYLKQSSIG